MQCGQFCCGSFQWLNHLQPTVDEGQSLVCAMQQARTLYFSASCTMRSMSSFDRRPLSFVIVILFLVPGRAIATIVSTEELDACKTKMQLTA